MQTFRKREDAIRAVQENRRCSYTEAQAFVEDMVERDVWRRTDNRQGIIIPGNATIEGRR